MTRRETERVGYCSIYIGPDDECVRVRVEGRVTRGSASCAWHDQDDPDEATVDLVTADDGRQFTVRDMGDENLQRCEEALLED
jgi:hypothetical protein